jgi:formylglycine-generating enzyme required for sulfatase activity
MLLALAGTACDKGTQPLEQVKARQKAGAGGETKGSLNELAVDLGSGLKLETVLIPAGEFMMGSPDSDDRVFPTSKPQHGVRIPFTRSALMTWPVVVHHRANCLDACGLSR